MFWVRCNRHQASLLRVQGTSFRATKIGIENKVKPITTLTGLETLDHDQKRSKNDSTRDDLDERIGECSKWVGKQFQIDQTSKRSFIDIDEGKNDNLILDRSDVEDLELDRINKEFRRLISKDQIDEAIKLFKGWQQTHSLARKDKHLNSKKPNDSLQLERGYLYEDTVRYLILWCIRNEKKRTSEQVLFALSQPEVPQTHDTARLLRSYIPSRTNLILLLPENLKILKYQDQMRREEKGKIPKDEFRDRIEGEVRQRLFIPIVIALVLGREVRAAHWLLKRCEEIGIKQMPIGTENVLAEAAVQHVRASRGSNGFEAIHQILLAVRCLNNCQDVVDDILIKVNARVVHRVWELMRQDDSFSFLQPREWREMLRKLSLICLRSDTLMMRSLRSRKSGIAILISLHIKVEDYTYAKRLFELYQDYYGRYTNESPFNPSEFAWMFEESLKAEYPIDFLSQLFNHWLISDLSSTDRMPNFHPSRLSRYSHRLMEAKRGDEVLPLLPLFGLGSETDVNEGQQKVFNKIGKRAQARRIVGTFANASPTFFIEFIPFLQNLLAFLRSRSKDQFDEHLIELHLFVIDKSRNSEKYVSSLELLRAQMLSIVESMRLHVVQAARNNQNMTSETAIALQLLYRRILRYLGDILAADKALYRVQNEDRDVHLADTLNNMLIEMQSLWSMDLEEVDRKSMNSAISVCRLQIMMGKRDWQGAFELFSKFMHDNAEQWQRFAELSETGKSKEKDVYPPTPFALNVVTRLSLALGQGKQFDKARQVLSTYTHCTKHFKSTFSRTEEEREQDIDLIDLPKERKETTRIIEDKDRLLMESTGIALLCMQNRNEDALARIYSLERLGVFGAPPQPQTPLMFFWEGNQTQKAGFNFNSKVRPTLFPSAAPSIGPTNKELALIYIEALASIPMKIRSADWQGLIANSQNQLSDYTGAKRIHNINHI